VENPAPNQFGPKVIQPQTYPAPVDPAGGYPIQCYAMSLLLDIMITFIFINLSHLIECIFEKLPLE
jgi:hypothetical protein